MAGAFVSLVFDANRGGIDPSATLVLLALADHANLKRGGLAWPSNATLCKRTGLGERQVRAHLRTLEEKHLITRVTAGAGGRGRATTYELEIVAMLRSMSPEKAAAHCRELRKIPGTLPPGFTVKVSTNPATHGSKPGGQARQPGDAAHETRRPAAPEPEVEPEFITGSGTGSARTAARVAHGGGATIAQLVTPVIKRLKGEPEDQGIRDSNGNLTPEETERRRQNKRAKLVALGLK